MKTALFDYKLPPERIAQEPATERDASRLLVVDRASRSIEHRRFSDILEYLGPNDRIFRNVARVLPARIFAQRPTGGHVECLLLRPAGDDPQQWWCLLRPGRRLPIGATFGLADRFEAKVAERTVSGECRVQFTLFQHASLPELAECIGKMPLPPYIYRERSDERDIDDRIRYQTVYAEASKAVAAAAPTAGLHFTDELTQKVKACGAVFHDLALHVGMGTFRPLETVEVEDHPIHEEIYELSEGTQRALRGAPDNGKRRICVGTTSARSVEDYFVRNTTIQPGSFIAEADTYIYPPRQFRGVDALITNFHLPRSTLLCLVAAFLSPGNTDGIAWLHEIYQEAIRREYRFLSFGDAMFIR